MAWTFPESPSVTVTSLIESSGSGPPGAVLAARIMRAPPSRAGAAEAIGAVTTNATSRGRRRRTIVYPAKKMTAIRKSAPMPKNASSSRRGSSALTAHPRGRARAGAKARLKSASGASKSAKSSTLAEPDSAFDDSCPTGRPPARRRSVARRAACSALALRASSALRLAAARWARTREVRARANLARFAAAI